MKDRKFKSKMIGSRNEEFMQRSIINLKSNVIAAATVVGGKEHEGPLSGFFDLCDPEDSFGQDTWEKSESEMQRRALAVAMKKSGLAAGDIDVVFAGDLLNQCVGSAYGLLDYGIPYFGLYGACSTSAESIMLAAILTSGGFATRAAAVTSSHNCSAERQFRTPTEYGGQRSPTAQWTVTGAGAYIVGQEGSGARITEALPGIAVDKGISDASNMGAAMAPAAMDTLVRYFTESGRAPRDFDMILTGDLGYEGSSILCELLKNEGIDISRVHSDCGMMIYNRETQDVHSGGSGCGCAATVLGAYVLPKLERGELSDVLFLATGAMMSPASIQQGLSIPSIAHLLHLEAPKKEDRKLWL